MIPHGERCLSQDTFATSFVGVALAGPARIPGEHGDMLFSVALGHRSRDGRALFLISEICVLREAIC